MSAFCIHALHAAWGTASAGITPPTPDGPAPARYVAFDCRIEHGANFHVYVLTSKGKYRRWCIASQESNDGTRTSYKYDLADMARIYPDPGGFDKEGRIDPHAIIGIEIRAYNLMENAKIQIFNLRMESAWLYEAAQYLAARAHVITVTIHPSKVTGRFNSKFLGLGSWSGSLALSNASLARVREELSPWIRWHSDVWTKILCRTGRQTPTHLEPEPDQYQWHRVFRRFHRVMGNPPAMPLALCIEYVPDWLAAPDAPDGVLRSFSKEKSTRPKRNYFPPYTGVHGKRFDADGDGRPGPFTHEKKWQRFVKNIVTKFQEEQFDLEFVEVWNEPIAKVFFAGKIRDYLNLYYWTSLAVRDTGARVAGPSHIYNTRDLIDFAKTPLGRDDIQGLPLDVLSWHAYAAQPYQYARQSLFLRKILDDAGYTDTELCLDEWANAWRKFPKTQKNTSAPYHAAYIAQAIKEFHDVGDRDRFTSATYWCLKKGPGNEIFFEHEGKEYPSVNFNALKALNMLRGARCGVDVDYPGKGSGEIPGEDPVYGVGMQAMAGMDRQRGVATIALWHYTPGDADNRLQTPVVLDLSLLPACDYSYERYLIDRDHSSQHAFLRTGDPHRAELCKAPDSDQIIPSGTSRWRIKPDVPLYSLSLIRLAPAGRQAGDAHAAGR